MKTKPLSLIVITLALSVSDIIAVPMGTAFTYQGRLADGLNAANGRYDLKFNLYNASAAGSLISGPITNASIVVSNGLFTTTLDFGAVAFNGDARWLEASVRTNGSGAFVVLASRTQLTPTPYAIAASNLLGTLPSAQLGGTYSSPVTFNNAGNVFTGNGAGLVNLNPGALIWGSCPPWYTCGNAGTTAGLQFIGTTDDEPLELKVFNTRALRLEPNGAAAPNVIGGSPLNRVGAGATGVTIAGGNSNSVWSTTATVGGGTSNSVSGLSAVIAGGRQNTIDATPYATIGGGWSNRITEGFYTDAACTIAGGLRNRIDFEADWSTIGGGKDNVINRSYGATIAGGSGNTMLDQSEGATIGGGTANGLRRDCISSTIGGGNGNQIGYFSRFSTISGGSGNTMGELLTGSGFLRGATISGGTTNNIADQASYATIAGGTWNSISTNATYATISGGYGNALRWGAAYQIGPTNSTIGGGASNAVYGIGAVISGGVENRIGSSSSRPYEIGHVIGGGERNRINLENNHSTIGGGLNNLVDASTTTIAGGFSNRVEWAGGTYGNTIGGGEENRITSAGYLGYSVISGGRSNIVSGNYGTIPGGVGNFANEYSFAAGRRAKADDQGAFVWADSTDADFASTATNQFLIRASGGVGINTSTPGSSLQVNGGIRARGGSPGGFGGNNNGYAFAGNGGDVDSGMFSSADGQLEFFSNAQERMRIDPDGKVGIGRVATGNRLEVEGDASKSVAGSWLANSDARIKRDVQPIAGALDRLARVQLVSFRYTEDYRAQHPAVEDRRYLNVLAQQFRDVFPEHVKASGEHLADGSEILQVDTYPLTIYSAAAVQELNQKLEQKEMEITELKQRLERLERLMSGKSGGAK